MKPNSREIEVLKNTFPQYFDKDGNFYWDRFKEVFKNEEISLNKEGYELNFLGKSYARYLSSTRTETFIAPHTEHNEAEENKDSENLYIIGDNLDALKHLLGSYAGKIKCIYIDPPYNTGSDGFVYPDNFYFDAKKLSQMIGVEEEEAQRIINIKGKSSHSAWLTFMYPRLILARELLSDDGVIFISIDDNEQANLKLMCDEIFGEENFVSDLVWRKKTGASDAKGIANITENILVYIKHNAEDALKKAFSNNKESYNIERYSLEDEYADVRGSHYTDNLDRGGLQYSDSMNYGIEAPDGTTLFPNGRTEFVNDGWTWKWSKQKVEWGIKNGFIVIEPSKRKNSGWAVKYKNYLNVDNEGEFYDRSAAYKNVILDIINSEGTNEIKDILGGNYFSNPKPSKLIYTLMKYVHDADIILDFFSGSATTAHTVMKLNAEDGGSRKYILVQLPELIKEDKPAYKEGYRTIDEIGRERIRRAAKKIQEETGAQIDYGFKTYSLESLKEEILTNLDYFDDNPKLILYDMVGIFDTDKSKGKDAILSTYLALDGYGLNVNTQKYRLSNFEADKIENSIYMIDNGLDSDDVMELIKRIETLELDITRVVVYAPSLSFHVL
ncbi:MAG: site-specific DNA-methyltransferase, partial [Lachnospiraceae bacterium]